MNTAYLDGFTTTAAANNWLNAADHRTLFGSGKHVITEPIKLLANGAHFDGRNCQLIGNGSFIQHGEPGRFPTGTYAHDFFCDTPGPILGAKPDVDSVAVWHLCGLNTRTANWRAEGVQRALRFGTGDGWNVVHVSVEHGSTILANQACEHAATPVEIFTTTGGSISDLQVRGRADSSSMTLMLLEPKRASDSAMPFWAKRPHIDTFVCENFMLQSMDNADKSRTGAAVGLDMIPNDGAINHTFFDRCIWDHTTQFGWRILSRVGGVGQVRGVKLTDCRMDLDNGIPFMFRNRSRQPVEDIRVSGGTFIVPGVPTGLFRESGFTNINFEDCTFKSESSAAGPDFAFREGAEEHEFSSVNNRYYLWDGA